MKVEFGPLPFTLKLLGEMVAYIQQESIGLVVVDTVHVWWNLSDENNAAEMLHKVIPLLTAIRRTSAAWLGLSHTRKGGGEGGEEIRGSSALHGLVDIAVSMKKTEAGGNQRSLTSTSRYGATPSKLIIEFGSEGYRGLGGPDQVSSEGKAHKLLAALSDVGQTVDELAEVSSLSKQDISRAVTRLETKVVREGIGHKGDPFRYRRNSIRPTSQSEGVGLDKPKVSVNDERTSVPEIERSELDGAIQDEELTHV